MIAELVSSFDRSLSFMRDLVADLSDEEMVRQPSGVPNHGAWTLGHVIYSCQAMAAELGVPPWLPDDWESRYGSGTVPRVAQEGERFRKTALVATLEDAAARLRAALLATSENRLGDPLPDENTRELLPTVGHALVQVVAAHTAFHAGQLAAWRRAIGRPSRGVFL